MTERSSYTERVRLEQRSSYRKNFSGEVVKVIREGERVWVVLDQSLFYPTSGGQPHDTGTLGDARVVEVRKEEGEVRYLVQGGDFEVGRCVGGETDKEVLPLVGRRGGGKPELAQGSGNELERLDEALEYTANLTL